MGTILFDAALALLFIGGFAVWLTRSIARDRERALVWLAARPCPKCNAAIGDEGARAAMQKSLAAKKAFIDAAAREGKRVRVNEVWDIECPACGARLEFDARTPSLSEASAQS
jgi:hypothetical protein